MSPAAKEIELSSRDGVSFSRFRLKGDVEGKVLQEDRDRAALMRIGKTPVLKRSYNFWTISGFSCCILITWEAVLTSMNIGLNNGGRAGMIYMYLVAWVGATCTFTTLSELSSMAPISSGQYFWVSMLAPASSQKTLSYITGWMTVVAWQALAAAAAFTAGLLLRSLTILAYPDYPSAPWQGSLIVWAIMLFAFAINTVARELLPRLEGLIIVIHVAGALATIIPVLILSEKASHADVWTTFYNGGGWNTQGLSTLVGLIMPIYLFTGVDGAIHMAEEIQNASVVIPNSIMFSVFLNGALGFAVLISFAYATLDIEAALNSPVGLANDVFVYILQQSLKSNAGVFVISSIPIFMAVWATTSMMAAGSRMLWAFCRDQAVPGWSFFVKLNRRTNLPVRCMMLTVTVGCLLALIYIGSATVLSDLFGLVASAFYASYLIVMTLLLWRRLTGAIRPADDFGSDELVNTVGKKLVWGPWHIPGIWGIIVNVISCLYLVLGLFWSFWPSFYPATAATMNYNCVLFGAVVIVAAIYYFAVAKGKYSGPIVEPLGSQVEVLSHQT